MKTRNLPITIALCCLSVNCLAATQYHNEDSIRQITVPFLLLITFLLVLLFLSHLLGRRQK